MAMDRIEQINNYDDFKESKFGVYFYRRQSTGEILYVGKDSNIHINRRHLDHIAPSKRTEQRFNRYLQSSASKDIEYGIFGIYDNKENMETTEDLLILFLKSIGQCEFNLSTDFTRDTIDAIAKTMSDLDILTFGEKPIKKK